MLIKLLSVRVKDPLQSRHGWISGTLTAQFFEMYYEPKYQWIRVRRPDWPEGEWECLLPANVSSFTPESLPEDDEKPNRFGPGRKK